MFSNAARSKSGSDNTTRADSDLTACLFVARRARSVTERMNSWEKRDRVKMYSWWRVRNGVRVAE